MAGLDLSTVIDCVCVRERESLVGLDQYLAITEAPPEASDKGTRLPKNTHLSIIIRNNNKSFCTPH